MTLKIMITNKILYLSIRNEESSCFDLYGTCMNTAYITRIRPWSYCYALIKLSTCCNHFYLTFSYFHVNMLA